ncbi:hypothetical protein TNCT_236791 [Trichonephila clavata]|uniref:Uncharacterized protein n=1 Tax=Trichonephila clavata TaxID=2740835 RepID=A0A8X6M6N3_TRICU|nr:hypothetical protein TNCT_236791 [Trichonephila clavata]
MPGYSDHSAISGCDFDSFLPFPCTIPNCSLHETPKNTPASTPPLSPTRRSNPQKRKGEDNFEFARLRKTAKVRLVEIPTTFKMEMQQK